MDSTNYLQQLLALTLILAMIFAATWAARRWGLGALAVRVPRGAAKRLGVVEVLVLDPKRRLVLVRRDDREHLLLVGGEVDVVVEANCPLPRFELPTTAEARP